MEVIIYLSRDVVMAWYRQNLERKVEKCLGGKKVKTKNTDNSCEKFL